MWQPLTAVFLTMLALTGCGSGGASREGSGRLGWVGRTVFDDPSYPQYHIVYDTSQIASEFVETIRKLQDGVDYVVFFGLWCSDSQREVPRFLKLVDSGAIVSSKVRLYSLDQRKKSPAGVESRYSIERVPTFILLRGDEELGRIVERPKSSLEGDILMILATAQPHL